MNRSARRRNNNDKKVVTYNLTEEQINQIKKEATDKALETAFTLMLGIPLMVLRDKYGFGKKRMNEYIDYALETYDSFNKGYFTLEDVEKMLREEVEVNIRRG